MIESISVENMLHGLEGRLGEDDYIEPLEILINSAKKVGIELYNVDYVGLHISEDNGKLFLNSFEFDKNGEAILPKENGEKKYQKPIEINPKNTLLFARGLGTYGYTANRRYVDYIRLLEDKGFKTIPSVKTPGPVL